MSQWYRKNKQTYQYMMDDRWPWQTTPSIPKPKRKQTRKQEKTPVPLLIGPDQLYCETRQHVFSARINRKLYSVSAAEHIEGSEPTVCQSTRHGLTIDLPIAFVRPSIASSPEQARRSAPNCCAILDRIAVSRPACPSRGGAEHKIIRARSVG